MRRRLAAVLLAVLPLTALPSFAADAPELFGPLDAGIAAERAAIGDPVPRAAKKTAKAYDKARKLFASAKAVKSLKDEVRTTGKVLKLLEKKAPAAGLGEEAGALLDGYESVIEELRGELDSLILFGAVEGKAAGKANKAVAKVDAALAAAAAEETASGRAKHLLQAAGALGLLDRLVPPGGDLEQAWYVASLGIAAGDVGHDFDGDGTADNAFGASLATIEGLTGEPLPDFLTPAIEDGTLVLIFQAWALDGWGTADPFAWFGAFQGLDADENPTDNASGSEVFGALPGVLDADGHALLRAPTDVDAGGGFEWVLDDEFALRLAGGIELPTAGPFVIAGTIGPAAGTGYLAFPVPSAAVELLLDAVLPQEIGGIFDRETVINLALLTLLDLDLDGDGTKDAMSMALEFDAVSCSVEP